jgi:hypothetical protein
MEYIKEVYFYLDKHEISSKMKGMKSLKFRNYEEFWPFYLSQHSQKKTRFWHFVGTSTILLWVILAIVLRNGWILLLAPVVAYGFAWYSHFFIEGNKPATFGHPFWSLRADFQMYWCILTGKIEEEIQRIQNEQEN